MADVYHDYDNGHGKQQRRNTLKCERQLMLEKFLYAMKEDLADWLSSLMGVMDGLTADSFMASIENGVILCQHANLVQDHIEDYKRRYPIQRSLMVPKRGCQFKSKGATPGSFIARDNVANFIAWCRGLGISDVVIFESEDLVLRKNERSVILTLLDVARRASKFGVRPPEIVKFEEEIELEIERDKKEPERIQRNYVLERDNDLDHLMETLIWPDPEYRKAVQEVINQCTCPIQFPITKVGEGKYKVGQNTTLIFVRVMRNHVMVRVGGGWDTLEHYIEKHDPCRIQDRIDSTRSPRGGPSSQPGQYNMDNGSDTCSACSSESLESNPYQTPRRTRRHSSNSTDMQNDPSNEEITQSFRRANTDMGPFRYQSRRAKEDPLSSKRYRAVSLETELKDCSVYDPVNPSDSWLRRQLNEIKREKGTKDLPPAIKVSAGKQTTPGVQKTGQQRETRDRRYAKAENMRSGLPRPTFTTRSLSWSLNGTESKNFHEQRAMRGQAAQRPLENGGSVVAKRRKSSPSDMVMQRPIRIPQRSGSVVKYNEEAVSNPNSRRTMSFNSPVMRSDSLSKVPRPRMSDVTRPQFHKSKTMDLPVTGRIRTNERKSMQAPLAKRTPQRDSSKGVPKSHTNEITPKLSNKKTVSKNHGHHAIDTAKAGTNGYRKKESLQSPSKQNQGSCRAMQHQRTRSRSSSQTPTLLSPYSTNEEQRRRHSDVGIRRSLMTIPSIHSLPDLHGINIKETLTPTEDPNDLMLNTLSLTDEDEFEELELAFEKSDEDESRKKLEIDKIKSINNEGTATSRLELIVLPKKIDAPANDGKEGASILIKSSKVFLSIPDTGVSTEEKLPRNKAVLLRLVYLPKPSYATSMVVKSVFGMSNQQSNIMIDCT